MRHRISFAALFLVGLLMPLVGCEAPASLTAISISPSSSSIAASGTVQYTATGTYSHGSHPAQTADITSLVSWSSSSQSVATITSSGLATGVGAGSTTITASAPGFNGLISATAPLTVTGGGSGTTSGAITAITVIPGTQVVSSTSETSQFLAIGTTSSGATVSMTGNYQVAWKSSSLQIATIDPLSGLAIPINPGTVTITALYTNSAANGGTTITGSATLTVSGGSLSTYTAIALTPAAQSISASGGICTFAALGTLGSSTTQEDVTTLNSSTAKVVWSSSAPQIAAVSTTTPGQVNGVSAGTATITAELQNLTNGVVTSVVSASASVTVNNSTPSEPLLSLTIVPNAITVLQLQDTGQFLAIGTFSTAPYVRDLTNTVTWISSWPNVFPVSTNTGSSQGQENAGVVNAYGSGGATIIAEATDPTTGSIQTATATFNCPYVVPNPPTTPGSCFPGSQATALFSTLTVYNEGLNTTGWLITAPSATGTANVIHCGPGWTVNGNTTGSVCTATYPAGTVVTLTAPKETNVNFGGWSYNCTPVLPVNQTGPNSCQVTLTSDDVVGAVFN